jgi:hypothetical protein
VVLAGVAIPTFRGRMPASLSRKSAPSGNLAKAENWKLGLEHGGDGTMEPATYDGAPGFKVTTRALGKSPWNVSVVLPLHTPLGSADTVVIKFRARADQNRSIPLLLQKNTPGFPDFWRGNADVTPTWQSFSFEAKAIPCQEWEPMLALHAGGSLGNLEIADFVVARK